LRDLGVDGTIILKQIFNKFIGEFQARDKWRVLVNKVMNIRVSQNVRNFLAI
jgi:hypothetical protein